MLNITLPNTPRKLVWRAEITLATADGNGTFVIMRRANTSILARERRALNALDEILGNR